MTCWRRRMSSGRKSRVPLGGFVDTARLSRISEITEEEEKRTRLAFRAAPFPARWNGRWICLPRVSVRRNQRRRAAAVSLRTRPPTKCQQVVANREDLRFGVAAEMWIERLRVLRPERRHA